MKKKFSEMHDQQMKQQGQGQQSASQQPSPRPRSGDYIDFEEIK